MKQSMVKLVEKAMELRGVIVNRGNSKFVDDVAKLMSALSLASIAESQEDILDNQARIIEALRLIQQTLANRVS